MRRITLILGCALIVCSSTIYSQSFCATFGGSGVDNGYDILATGDGGFIVAGSTTSYGEGGSDIYVVKFDMFGNGQWTRVVGGIGNEIAYGIDVASNGDYVICGETNSVGANGEAYVVRLDASGNLLWNRAIGGFGTEIAREISATSDNGCVIIGGTDTYGQGGGDMYTVKLNSAGTVQWSSPIGTINPESGYGILAASDGSIVVVGRCFPLGFGGAQPFVIKYDSNGNVIWNKYFTSHDDSDFFVPSDMVEANGGYVISGYTDTSNGSNKGSFLTKISTSGNHQWTRIIGTPGNDNGYSMEKTSDGGFIISGIYFGSTAAAFITKTDSSGVPVWYSRSTTPGNSYSYGVIQLNNGTYISAGNTDAVDGTDIFLIQLDAIGNTCCATSVAVSNGLLATTSATFGTAGTGVGIDSVGVADNGGSGLFSCISPAGVESTLSAEMIHVYPNPALEEVTIVGLEGFDHLSVVNALGGMMYEVDINAGEIKLQLTSYPAGVYFINLYTKEKLVTKKFFVE